MEIAVFGAGYVGLVTAVCLASQGHRLCVVEKDRAKLDKLRSGHAAFYEPELEGMLADAAGADRIHFTNNSGDAVHSADLLFVCVGTPPLPDGSADLSQVEEVMKTILKHETERKKHEEDKGKLVVIKSTVPVGTAYRLKRMADLYGNGAGEIEVASNPEFLREGSAVRDFMQPDRIVIGTSGERGEAMLRSVYRNFDCPVLVTDTNTAEMIKYASNSFLATKISFINMISDLCDKVQADISIVAAGMGYDKRIGEQFLKAGIGFGGSCFPKDLSALTAVGRKHHVKVELLEQVIGVNRDRPLRLMEKLKEEMWVLKGKTIVLLGLTFKPNTDDVRDCPAASVAERLLKEQANVVAYDPAGMANFKSLYPELSARIRFADDAYEACRRSDGIVLLTEWPVFKELDWGRISANMEAPFLLDARHFLEEAKLKQAGFIRGSRT
ncbi:UDP-glucose dehydrogenase family protein [Paenibacillus nanensis]|uniref:UDP-glucose dehydrogenase family protein n=1 Tax=Paenibacillus nanensis TaxID=393251 RepID=UPI0013C30C6C|nr:UDP-glucose/GDP-mannose dehydrogenase family protein [Paenibacillus nanensis]